MFLGKTCKLIGNKSAPDNFSTNQKQPALCKSLFTHNGTCRDSKTRLHPKKRSPSVLPKTTKTKKNNRFSVQNSIFKIWKKETERVFGFIKGFLTGGERSAIFSYPLSSYAKCMSYMQLLLELVFEMHSTIWEAFLLLPLLFGVSLKNSRRQFHSHFSP
jgi:hypothetical protein